MYGLHLGLSGGKKDAGTKNDRDQERILVYIKVGSHDYLTLRWVGVYGHDYGALEEQRFRARIPLKTARNK